MNLDDFPFNEISLASNTEDELLKNVEDYFEETKKFELEGSEFVIKSSPVGEYSLVPNVMKVYVALGKFSEKRYLKRFPPMRKLRARLSIESAQDLAAAHNMDISDDLIAGIVAEINKEARQS